MNKPKLYTYEWLERNGRLGNQLWQIAAMANMAIENKGEVYFKPDWEYRPYFSMPDEWFTKPENLDDYEVIDGQTLYYQELPYIEPHWAEIKDYFSFSPRALEQFSTTPEYDDFMHYHMLGLPTCSIHVRRGDYLKYPTHFPVPTPAYYRTAIQSVLADEPNTNFFVFSDDIKWCKNAFGGNKPQMHYVTGVPRPVEVVDRIGEPQDWLDMLTMSLCERHIIGNSTFSWWGAWLSEDKNVIYPSRWFGRHPGVKDIPWRLMIPSNWQEVQV